MEPQVVVVGSFVQDLTWKCAGFPQVGETVIGTFVTGPGGKGSNQAVAAGRAGAPTLFIGAVGRDVFAAAAKKFYQAEGIGARWVVKPKHATGAAAILVSASGQNEIVVALGASAELQPRDVEAALFRGAKVVVCQHEANLPVNTHVFRLARKAGATTVLNPAPMRPDFDPAVLPFVDVLIPNETEFTALMQVLPAAKHHGFSGRPLHSLAPDEVHALCRIFGVPTVIVTLGERGCFISQAGGHASIPAHTGIKVIDTTGAGDAFVGGFAAGLVTFKGDVIAAARHGNTVAALSVTKFGTAPSMPTKREILRFQKARGI
ncbi:MAG TPA: ribokinase [Opitutaceae bacterium]|nr:ribokinase [Opitutaceae bacterium]